METIFVFMLFNPNRHHRRSIRLRGWDYTRPGTYFVTLCVQNRACLFGNIVNGHMHLNAAGMIVRKCWHDIPDHFPMVELDEYVVMPNHVHGIIAINRMGPPVGANNDLPLPERPQQPNTGTSRTLGSVVRGFKIGVTKWFRANTDVQTVWQRNYYENIIRTGRDLNRIRRYISDNPRKWNLDCENPER